MDENTRLLSVPDLAEALKIPRSSIYELTKKGEIPHLKFGRHIRFDLDDVLRSRRSKAPADKGLDQLNGSRRRPCQG